MTVSLYESREHEEVDCSRKMDRQLRIHIGQNQDVYQKQHTFRQMLIEDRPDRRLTALHGVTMDDQQHGKSFSHTLYTRSASLKRISSRTGSQRKEERPDLMT